MVRELVRLEEVHRAFGPLTVLEGVNLRIDEGDRIGVVGHNGAGKTTLLRTISNQDQDLGDISFAAGLRLAFLTQIRDLDEKKISLLEIPTGNPLIIKFDSNNKIIKCFYLDKKRASDLLIFN